MMRPGNMFGKSKVRPCDNTSPITSHPWRSDMRRHWRSAVSIGIEINNLLFGSKQATLFIEAATTRRCTRHGIFKEYLKKKKKSPHYEKQDVKGDDEWRTIHPSQSCHSLHAPCWSEPWFIQSLFISFSDFNKLYNCKPLTNAHI